VPVVGVDHVQLAMPAGREAEARAFYSGVLGIPRAGQARRARGARRGLVRARSAQGPPGRGPDFRPARKAHPGLLVRDLDALIENLRRAGYPVVSDAPLEGYLRVYVDDPFGNRLELMEPRSGG